MRIAELRATLAMMKKMLVTGALGLTLGQSLPVKENGAGACGALVDGEKILLDSHNRNYLPRCSSVVTSANNTMP